MEVIIDSKKLRIYLREWLGYLAVKKEELEKITANVLEQTLCKKDPKDTYILSHPRIYNVEDDSHTIFFIAKGVSTNNALILKAYVTNQGYNNLEVYYKNHNKHIKYVLEDNFTLTKLEHNNHQDNLKLKRNYVRDDRCYNITLTKGKTDVNIQIFFPYKAIKYILRMDTLEEALLSENYFNISLSKIIDILSCSFKGKNFLKSKITIIINTPEENFKIRIGEGKISTIVSKSNNEVNYYFGQRDTEKLTKKEFKGIGKELKESVKILERNHKEFKES